MILRRFHNDGHFVIRNKNKILFRSYDSNVALIDAKGLLRLGPDWDFSKTTLKYLCRFLEEYKNDLEGYTYSCIGLGKLENAKNKKKYIQDLIKKKVIKVSQF